MNTRYLYIILLILFVPSAVNAQNEKADELFHLCSEFGQVEVTFPYPGFDDLTNIGRKVSVSKIDNGTVTCILTEYDIDTFLAFNLNYKIIYREGSKAVESALSVDEAMNWDLYPTYPQYDTIIHRFAEDYPSICRIDTIGESIEGRQILALKISDNVEQDEDEPEVFYTSNIHGDELQGFVLMLRLAEHLLVNAGNGGIEQALVDSLEIWINPLSNPDGTYYGGDTITTPTRSNANGTDLNRNFPDPFDPSIYPDVENQQMISFMRERNFVLSANFHAGYEVVNFPWDRWLSKVHADSIWFNYISRRYADTVHNYSVASYMDSQNNGVVRGAVWYVIYGGRQDFVTYELQGREVTIELDDTKETPAAQLPLLWDYNYRSFLGYLENAMYGIHGKVIDDSTGEPINARIFIEGHDTDSSHVYSDSLNGSFIRMLNEGTWDLTVSADGYETELIPGVQVNNMQQRYIVIRLAGVTEIEDLPEHNSLAIWPVPAHDRLVINSTGMLGQMISIDIINSGGALVKELNDLPVYSERIELNISDLIPGYYIVSIKSDTGKYYGSVFIKH